MTHPSMNQQSIDVPDVVVERFIRATPQRVFEALTNPNDLERWFFSEARTDPRPGGGYEMTWRSDSDPSKDHIRIGRYLEFIPGNKLVFEWAAPPRSDPAADCTACGDLHHVGTTIVTVTLAAENDGTRVRLVHTGWKKDERTRASRNSHNDGWSYYVDHLGAYLTGGSDTRTAHHGQLVRSA